MATRKKKNLAEDKQGDAEHIESLPTAEIDGKKEIIDVSKIKEKVLVPVITATPAFGGRVPYSNIARTLSKKELGQSGTQKLMVDELAKLSNECEELKKYQNNYYELYSDYCRLDEKSKKNSILDTLCDGLFTLGGVVAGTGLYFLGNKMYTETIISFGIGLLLILLPIMVKRKKT